MPSQLVCGGCVDQPVHHSALHSCVGLCPSSPGEAESGPHHGQEEQGPLHHQVGELICFPEAWQKQIAVRGDFVQFLVENHVLCPIFFDLEF